MPDQTPLLPDLLTPGEVAAIFRVDAKTVTRWAAAGYLVPIRTLGGHRRYEGAQVQQLIESSNYKKEAGMRTYDADDPRADKPLTKAEREAEEEADRKRDEKKNGK